MESTEKDNEEREWDKREAIEGGGKAKHKHLRCSSSAGKVVLCFTAALQLRQKKELRNVTPEANRTCALLVCEWKISGYV
jgi:hypothetical protein